MIYYTIVPSFYCFILFYNMRSSSISCFLFFSRLLCFSWSCFLFLLVFWWPSSASASVLAACNVFSDALPLLQAGVGGFLLLLALHAFKYFPPSPSLKLSFWHWFSGTLPLVPWGRRIFSSLLFLCIFCWNKQFDSTSLTAKECSSPFGTRPARTWDISPESENMFIFV